MNRELALSSELSDVLGVSAASRPDAVSRLWAYCRENGLLNPENKKEIRFDTKLEKMMGQPTATMPQLISLLTPHFDYTQPVVKQEAKKEPGKMEMKKEQQVKRETKQEKPPPPKQPTAKREQHA